MPNFNPKRVFSSRIDTYIKYRSGYPVEVINTLIKECGLAPDWHVADIGSGTGLLARPFLDFGCTVIGVEPNEEMRLAGDHILADYPGFTSLSGSAEDTGIVNASMNLVSAGMAFHWFDASRTRDEFRRILTVDGWVALVWHRMLTGPTLLCNLIQAWFKNTVQVGQKLCVATSRVVHWIYRDFLAVVISAQLMPFNN